MDWNSATVTGSGGRCTFLERYRVLLTDFLLDNLILPSLDTRCSILNNGRYCFPGRSSPFLHIFYTFCSIHSSPVRTVVWMFRWLFDNSTLILRCCDDRITLCKFIAKPYNPFLISWVSPIHETFIHNFIISSFRFSKWDFWHSELVAGAGYLYT